MVFIWFFVIVWMSTPCFHAVDLESQWELHQLSGKPGLRKSSKQKNTRPDYLHFAQENPQMSTHTGSSNIFLTFPITVVKPLSYWFCTKNNWWTQKLTQQVNFFHQISAWKKMKNINRSFRSFHFLLRIQRSVINHGCRGSFGIARATGFLLTFHKLQQSPCTSEAWIVQVAHLSTLPDSRCSGALYTFVWMRHTLTRWLDGYIFNGKCVYRPFHLDLGYYSNPSTPSPYMWNQRKWCNYQKTDVPWFPKNLRNNLPPW